jgi:hypothetical protein
MWLGEHCFGRADSKKLLLASYDRLQSPPSSFHWREVRRQRRPSSENREESRRWGRTLEEERASWSEAAF